MGNLNGKDNNTISFTEHLADEALELGAESLIDAAGEALTETFTENAADAVADAVADATAETVAEAATDAVTDAATDGIFDSILDDFTPLMFIMLPIVAVLGVISIIAYKFKKK